MIEKFMPRLEGQIAQDTYCYKSMTNIEKDFTSFGLTISIA